MKGVYTMPKLSRNLRVILFVFSLLAIVTLACGISAPQAVSNPTSTRPPATVEVIQVEPTASTAQIASIVSEDQVLVDMYTRLNPAVVNITVYLDQGGEGLSVAQGAAF